MEIGCDFFIRDLLDHTLDRCLPLGLGFLVALLEDAENPRYASLVRLLGSSNTVPLRSLKLLYCTVRVPSSDSNSLPNPGYKSPSTVTSDITAGVQ